MRQLKFAYLGIPHAGGTYTVYNSLRVCLASHGIDVRWVGLGPRAQATYDNPDWSRERENGFVVAGSIVDDRLQAQSLIRFIESSDFDGVFVNVLSGRVETNIIRYLNPSILRVMIVHNITPGTYSAAKVLREYVHATVGVSPRIKDDLTKKYGFNVKHTFVIPNAIEFEGFGARHNVSGDGVLKLLSLGRIVDSDKGVFWLPRILKQLEGYPVMLTIAGGGPDLVALKERFSNIRLKVNFVGPVSPKDVPSLFLAHDAFIFPSRFEGLGLTLVEAMAAGCVPVASKISGVTDFVIKDGESGLLFNIGNVQAATTSLISLIKNRNLLENISAAAQKDVRSRFNLSLMGSAYSDMIGKILRTPKEIRTPLPFSNWSYPLGLKSGLRTHLPESLKNWLRVMRERL